MPSKPLLIGALAIGAWSRMATAQQPGAAVAMQARVERLQARLESIESVRSIKRLQSAYGHYVEFGLWNDFANLFTDDAVTNYQQGARGKAEIRRLFFEQVGQGKLGLADGRIYPHILFQPVITLAPDGRTARGRWRILAMLGGYGGSATWYSGVYENEYVLENGAWKISVLRSEPRVTAAYTAAGWKDSGTHIPFHYTAAMVTRTTVTGPIPDAPATPSRIVGDAPSSLAGRVLELGERAARLRDQAEVTNLQDTLGYAVDGKLWNRVADLFAADGTLEPGLRGVYVGKASIRKALDQFGPQGLREGELNDHVWLQTIVSVAPGGRTAKARGVELIMASSPGGRNGELSEGVFENTFVRQGGAWKIQSVHFYPRMIVDAAAGWAKSAKPAPGPRKEYPPDRPPTSSYEIYPRFAVAPFHFNNPVTGKPPQYPAGVPATVFTEAASVAPAVKTIRNPADLAVRLTELERSVAAAEAYDAAENLIGAYGYYSDESPADVAGLFVPRARLPENASQSVFVNQILQPVIDVAPDGKTASVRARLLDPGGTSGGPGYWTAGSFEGRIVSEEGAWRFQTARSVTRWTAPYPGGWARIR